jgi:hypothetical protein
MGGMNRSASFTTPIYPAQGLNNKKLRNVPHRALRSRIHLDEHLP